MGAHFDTHDFVKVLASSGLTDAQAEAIMRAVAKSIGEGVDNLAGKADLNVLRAEMTADLMRQISTLRSEFGAQQAGTRMRPGGLAGTMASGLVRTAVGVLYGGTVAAVAIGLLAVLAWLLLVDGI
jgi:hypothetical protein